MLFRSYVPCPPLSEAIDFPVMHSTSKSCSRVAMDDQIIYAPSYAGSDSSRDGEDLGKVRSRNNVFELVPTRPANLAKSVVIV